MATKPVTNPRNIVLGLREKFLNDDDVRFEIRGYWGVLVHEWRIDKTVNYMNERISVSCTHTRVVPETGERDEEGGDIEQYTEETRNEILSYIEDDILDNNELTITYIRDDNDIKYDCRGNFGIPSSRCYDRRAKAAAINISRNVKRALASPYTELGRRRIMSDYRDLVGGNSFGGNNSKIDKLIKYLNTL